MHNMRGTLACTQRHGHHAHLFKFLQFLYLHQEDTFEVCLLTTIAIEHITIMAATVIFTHICRCRQREPF